MYTLGIGIGWIKVEACFFRPCLFLFFLSVAPCCIAAIFSAKYQADYISACIAIFLSVDRNIFFLSIHNNIYMLALLNQII